MKQQRSSYLGCLVYLIPTKPTRTNEVNQINQTNVLDGVTVFLDRDGTLNYDPSYLKVAAKLKLLRGRASPGAFERAGAKLVVVTNQSGVGRGIITLKDLEAIHARLQGLFAGTGGRGAGCDLFLPAPP